MTLNIKPKLLLPVHEALHDLTLPTFLTPSLTPTALSFGLQDSGTLTSFQLHAQASSLCLDPFSPRSLHSGISSNIGSLDKSSLTRQSKEVHPYPNHYHMILSISLQHLTLSHTT